MVFSGFGLASAGEEGGKTFVTGGGLLFAIGVLIGAFRRSRTKDTSQEESEVAAKATAATEFEGCVQNKSRILDDLTAREFEQLARELFAKLGYRCTITPHWKDGGLDVIAEKKAAVGRGEYLIIECKHYVNSTVGASTVRELIGTFQAYPQATSAILVTSGRFSSGAREIAQRNEQIDLIDRGKLLKLLQSMSPVEQEGPIDEGRYQAIEYLFALGDKAHYNETVLHLFGTQDERDKWVKEGPPQEQGQMGTRQSVPVDEYGVFKAEHVMRVCDHRWGGNES